MGDDPPAFGHDAAEIFSSTLKLQEKSSSAATSATELTVSTVHLPQSEQSQSIKPDSSPRNDNCSSVQKSEQSESVSCATYVNGSPEPSETESNPTVSSHDNGERLQCVTEPCTPETADEAGRKADTATTCLPWAGVGNVESSRHISARDDACRVCHFPSTGRHYGVRSCEACKHFFKRASTSAKKAAFVCGGRTPCTIVREQRNKCQACRFAKCLAVGMKEHYIQPSRKSPKMCRLTSKHPKLLCESMSFDSSQSGEKSTSNEGITLRFSNADDKVIASNKSIPNETAALRRFRQEPAFDQSCEVAANAHGASSRMGRIVATIQALDPVWPFVAVKAQCTHAFTQLAELRDVFCRLVVLNLQWLAQSSLWNKFDYQDRCLLYMQSWSKLLLVNFEAFLLASGDPVNLACNFLQIVASSYPQHNAFVHALHQHLMGALETRVDRHASLSCLKKFALFNPYTLGLKDVQTVQKIRDELTQVFLSQSCSESPGSAAAVARLAFYVESLGFARPEPVSAIFLGIESSAASGPLWSGDWRSADSGSGAPRCNDFELHSAIFKVQHLACAEPQ